MPRITSNTDAQTFLRQVGLRVEEAVVKQVVLVLKNLIDLSFYDIYALGTKPDGSERTHICSRETARKIRKLYRAGGLDPYIEYLDSKEESGTPEHDQQLSGALHQNEPQNFRRPGYEEDGGLKVEFGSLSHSKRPGIYREYSSAWVLDVIITNASRTLPVGIKRFVLEITRGDESHILPHIGKDTYGSNEEVPFPDLALEESLRIEPVTTVRGKLRFLDRSPFGFNEGSVALILNVEKSDGQWNTYGLGEMYM